MTPSTTRQRDPKLLHRRLCADVDFGGLGVRVSGRLWFKGLRFQDFGVGFRGFRV